MKKKVLITGVGGVGVYAAHLLATIPGIEVYLGDVRGEFVAKKANSIFHSAYFFNNSDTKYPKIFPVEMDLLDLEKTKFQIEEIKPDVILHLATMLAAQKIRTSVAPELAKRIYDGNPVGTGLRPWAPGHTVLLYNLMLAIKETGISTHVVNGSGCDFLNVSFEKIGLPITCGLGDFVLAEPGLVKIIARKYSVGDSDVKIYMAGHHSLIMPLYFDGTNHGIPYYLKVEILGDDITDELDFENDIFPQLPEFNSWPLDATASDQEQTSGHAAQIVKAILFDTQEVMNVPGPQGKPGAYPCRVGANGVEIVIPRGTTLEELMAINEAGNVAEGFAEIRSDGTMVATGLTISIVEELFEIDWQYKEFKPQDALKAFKEINTAFEAYVKKVNNIS